MKTPLWWLTFAAVGTAFWAGLIFVAIHFITKWW